MLVATVGVRGAPGVTTTSVVLAHAWPRESLLVEADPAGSVLPYWQQAANTGPLSPQGGVLDLAIHAGTDKRPEGVLTHAQVTAGGVPILVGPPTADAATAITTWPTMASMFRSVPDTDVIADCGRYVSAQSLVTPLVAAADAVLVVTGATLTDAASLPVTLEAVGKARRTLDHTHVVVVSRQHRRSAHGHQGLQSVLDTKPGINDVTVHTAPWDPKTARAAKGETAGRRRGRLPKWAATFAAHLSDEYVRSQHTKVTA